MHSHYKETNPAKYMYTYIYIYISYKVYITIAKTTKPTKYVNAIYISIAKTNQTNYIYIYIYIYNKYT